MIIGLIYPAGALTRAGNRVTADRWVAILRSLGHRVHVSDRYDGRPYDVMIALHARRNAAAAARFHRLYPERALLVALTGTDLYRDIDHSAAARRSLEIATRLVLLQPEGISRLPRSVRHKACAIIQSAQPSTADVAPNGKVFQVCVLGNLRSVKDPLRAAMAARLALRDSRLLVVHAGRALDPRYEERARRESERNPRYHWVGEVTRARARRVLASSHLLVLTSRSEGGANVVSEALASGVPVISSDIGGTRGVLGADYPGLFPVGDTRALAALLERAERDSKFYRRLRAWCNRVAPTVSPERERKAWQALLAELETQDVRSQRRR